MPIKALKPIFRRSSEIISSVLDLVKGKLTAMEYSHVQRLLKNGAERDVIFVQGIVTGIQLAKMKKEAIQRAAAILKVGIDRAEKGVEVGKLFKKSEIAELEEILKGTFNLGARRRITATLSRADGILLSALVTILQKLT